MSVVEKLRKDGIAKSDFCLTPDELYDFRNYLDNTNVYNAHVQAKSTESKPIREVRGQRNWPMFCHTMQDVILAPYFFDLALQSFDVACEYFDEPPYLYSMNCFWTQPGVTEYQETHGWHRDGDDRKQLVMFLYGTDVNRNTDGAHLYQKCTANRADDSLGYHFTNPPGGAVEAIYGAAGTCFFSDTRGLHTGLRPSHPRMLAWARWGVTNPPISYHHDKLAPVAKELLGARYPESSRLQEAIRLIAA